MSVSISIVTAIHNSLPMNELFWNHLCANTVSSFELILVDNHSTDGSEKFFQNIFLKQSNPHQKLVYVRNETNQSYPISQIQGMSHCQNDFLFFLNNDLWCPPGWDVPMVKAIAADPLLVVSPSGQEAQPTQSESDRLKRRWRFCMRASKVWKTVFQKTEKRRLEKALEWMYGDLETFHSPTPQTENNWINGIKGDCLGFHRELLKYVQPWDARIEAADWHLYLNVASLHDQNPEIPLPRVLLDTYVHHFGRYSARQKYEPIDRSQMMGIDEFWGKNTVKRLWWGFHLPQ